MAAAAPHLESYLKKWNRIHDQTTRLIALAPNDKFAWKTCDSAWTLSELLHHLWHSEVGLVEAALTGAMPKEKLESKTTAADIVAAFNQSHEACVAKVTALTPEQLNEVVTPFGPDHAMPRQALLNMLHEHEIHHRGQLYTYLRMLDVELPHLFG